MADEEQPGTGQRAMVLVSKAREHYAALPARRRSRLLSGAVAIVAFALALFWYMGRPDWQILFSGLEGRDVQQVSQELAAAGISFQTSADGAGVEVPADQLDKARMEVVAKGMPQSGRLGFELFDKPNWVGSEFDERVNYQRAMEGELEHTISTLGVVRSARVHLVLPQQSLFSSETKNAKASVVLELKRSNLTREQIDSIRNLVAGAVEDLSPDHVTLVDANGRVNLEPHGDRPEDGDEEHALETRLVALLEPLAGPGNVRATVNVSYDLSSEDRTDEVYDPTQAVPLTMQKREQNVNGTQKAQGVPGTASNTPAAAAVGAVQGSSAAAAPGTPPLLQAKAAEPVFPVSGVGSESKEESATYAITHHTIHTEQGPGKIRRISAAIVVNDRATTEGTDKLQKTVWKPRTADEMHRLEGLAAASLGLDEARGDKVVLENVTFSSNQVEAHPAGISNVVEEAKTLVAMQPGLLRWSTLGLLGFALILLVLRPVAGQVVVTLKDPALLSASGSGNLEMGAGLRDAAMAGPQQSPALVEPGPSAAEQQRRNKLKASQAVFDKVAEHIRREPIDSTRLLEAWIGSEGGEA